MVAEGAVIKDLTINSLKNEQKEAIRSFHKNVYIYVWPWLELSVE